MRRVIASCDVGKSPDAPRLIRATGKEKPGAMSGLLAICFFVFSLKFEHN